MKKKMELRCFGFVPYNISEIQKGIQFGHAVVEYGLKYGNTKLYTEWAEKYKTFIILNGGTSNHTIPDFYNTRDELISSKGGMEKIVEFLDTLNVNYATFNEPDLNDMLSGIVFIVDERIFNKKDYPDFDTYFLNKCENANDLSKREEIFKEWVEFVGGSDNATLKVYLQNFRLA